MKTCIVDPARRICKKPSLDAYITVLKENKELLEEQIRLLEERHSLSVETSRGLAVRLEQRIARVTSLLESYIVHVGHNEGVNFIDGLDHHHPLFDDEAWEELKTYVLILPGDSG